MNGQLEGTIPEIPEGWRLAHSGDLRDSDEEFGFWYPDLVGMSKTALTKEIDGGPWERLQLPLQESVGAQIAANTSPDRPYFIIKKVTEKRGGYNTSKNTVDVRDLEPGEMVFVDGWDNLGGYHYQAGEVVSMTPGRGPSQLKVEFVNGQRLWVDTHYEEKEVITRETERNAKLYRILS